MQNLDDDSIAALLLRVHQHLENASSPPHRAAALTPLRVMLQVLESRVLVPATFRYASKILLSQLRHRYVWLRTYQLLISLLASGTEPLQVSCLLAAFTCKFIKAFKTGVHAQQTSNMEYEICYRAEQHNTMAYDIEIIHRHALQGHAGRVLQGADRAFIAVL